MGHTLILAEKPSQAKAYADALQHTKKQDGYIEVNDGRFFKEKAYITWGYGHLVELLSPEQYNETWKIWRLDQLPMFPEQFRFQVSKDKKKQFNIVKRLLNHSTEIIVATDCDREGENIARSIISLAGASHKPTKRLWINSLEVDEIQNGFRHLNNGNNYLPLYKEAQTRQYSDWLVGMNASRLYTLLLQKQGMKGVFSVGRVQTATLYLLYKRQKEIEDFVSQDYFTLQGKVQVPNGSFEAKHKQRFATKEEAQNILQEKGVLLDLNDGIIQEVNKERKRIKSPKLHSLSSLQSTANKQWKYSPSEVLKIAQSLYEKKVLSYPRTDSHFITDSEFGYIKNNLSNYQECIGVDVEVVYPDAQKRYVDNTKVEEHYALVPTKQTPNFSALNEKEKNIYLEVIATTLAMFAPDYEYEETKVEIGVKGINFEATGKVEKQLGWKSLFKNQQQAKKKETVLPAMEKDLACQANVEIAEGKTKPPKYYTEGQLINVMKHAGKEIDDEALQHTLKESEGIGTEATRASIIETLKHQLYIEIRKNQVTVLDKGKILCQAVEGTLLASPEMTAKWETYLKKIGKNEGSQEVFLNKIKQMIEFLMQEAPKKIGSMEQFLQQVNEKSFIGQCPRCNHEDGKIQDKGKFYGCSRYREGCTFTLPKKFLGKSISQINIKKLLGGEKTNLIKGFTSKKGKKFDASLRYDQTEQKITFEFPKG
ncbi:DNA topoisomerase 3 [Amphibacillus sp. Q70]|uniref:type IA DNA topoisomerase n=1 Tax=Amphibacillus sp. Q70 TaxID=3453416 RepID=UPI003F83F46B